MAVITFNNNYYKCQYRASKQKTDEGRKNAWNEVRNQINKSMGRLMNGRMDGRIDEWADEGKVGPTEVEWYRHIEICTISG